MEFKVWKDTNKYDIRPDHVQKYMHICQMHTIESLSFMTQTMECKFHIDSNAVCERGPASKIWIISFFDSDIQPGYKLSMKQANGRVELFRIPSGRAYALTGPARDAEHKFETAVKKYTIRDLVLLGVCVCVCVCVCIQLQERYRYVHSGRFLSGVHNRGGGCSLACILPFVFWLKHADQLQWRSDLAAEFERKVTVQIDQLYDQYILGADVDVESLQLFADQHPQFLNKDREAECAVFTLDRIMQLSAGHVCSLQVDCGAKFCCTKNPSLVPQGYGYVGHLEIGLSSGSNTVYHWVSRVVDADDLQMYEHDGIFVKAALSEFQWVSGFELPVQWSDVSENRTHYYCSSLPPVSMNVHQRQKLFKARREFLSQRNAAIVQEKVDMEKSDHDLAIQVSQQEHRRPRKANSKRKKPE